MTDEIIWSRDRKRHVHIVEQDGRYQARLYVGETPTLQHCRSASRAGAVDFAERVLGRKPETMPDFLD